MSTDRELLELAAKAAGIVVLGFFDDGSVKSRVHSATKWNPLADDGDALRLAAKLKFTIRTYDGHVDGCGTTAVSLDPWGATMFAESYAENPMKAIRLCITRAAAEIGRAMP